MEYGRTLVIHPKTAFLLDTLVEDKNLDMPNPLRDDNILVYYRKKKSRTYSEMDYFKWERKVRYRCLTGEESQEKPINYLVNLDFYNFAELIDIKPMEGSHFIYSMSEPFTEEDIETEILHNWLGHFGMKYHQLHASGHMSRTDLKVALEIIKPSMVYPVHTQGADRFREIYDLTTPPKKHKKYTF